MLARQRLVECVAVLAACVRGASPSCPAGQRHSASAASDEAACTRRHYCSKSGHLTAPIIESSLGPFEDSVQRSFTLRLEELIAVVAARLEGASVCFWADQGTLLAVWRHGVPVLRYDTDADVSIMEEDADRAVAALDAPPLLVVDWRERPGQPHLEVALLASPAARLDVYLWAPSADGGRLDSPAGFLESAPAEVLLPLRRARAGGAELWAPRDPEAWLLATEPEIYRPGGIRVPDRVFDFAAERYRRPEAPPAALQEFPRVRVVAWPSGGQPAAARELAAALAEQDWPASSLDPVLVAPERVADLPPGWRAAAPAAAGAADIVCLWPAGATFSWHRLTAQVAPLVSRRACATRLGRPRGAAQGGPGDATLCLRRGEAQCLKGLELDTGFAARWSRPIFRGVCRGSWPARAPGAGVVGDAVQPEPGSLIALDCHTLGWTSTVLLAELQRFRRRPAGRGNAHG
ncbi:unnamed protein product [Prorocentrum cordatum]|uniref:Uncharacterized protein n=1 Tax=Prorocentrum cordatum TaxID=2364126 RepID=A0ABN9V439_9DINO|nr:unnamed protein product [Polarella glacialis]